MFGQYNLQTCDELEIRRLLWSAGVRPELGGVTSTTTNTTTAHSHSSHQQPPPPTFPLVTRPSESQRSSMPATSRGHHHHHQQRQLSPSGHLAAQYNATPSPAHTQVQVPGFSQNQRLSFIPQHIFPGQDMMPYNLGNKASSQQQQHLTAPTTSVIRTPQGNQSRGRSTEPPMPSMPNLFTPNQIYSRESFTNFSGPVFQQQQEREDTPEREMSEEDPPANGEDSGDDDYECEEEEDDDEIVEEVTGPFHCGFCQKLYKRKANYLAHLKEAHNRSSTTPPNPKPRKNSSDSRDNRKTFTPLLPPQRQPRNENQPQSASGGMFVDRREAQREEQNDQDLPDESPESINAAKMGDVYQCSKCRKKFKTEKNFRKHLQLHRQKEHERSSGQGELERAISGITEVPTHPQPHAHSAPMPIPIIAPDNYIISPALQLFKCPHCTEFFEDKEKLKNHEISVHKSTVCIDCGQLIPEAEFPQHKKKHLIEPPKWKCHKCQTSFDIYKTFKEHLQTHLAEPYKEPSQEFLTRKVPTVPIPLKEEDTQMDVKKPMMNQMRNQRPSIGMKIPNLNQVEMKRAVELYTGDKSDTDEATVLQVVMKSGQKTPSRARIRPSKQAKKSPRKGGGSSSRKSGKAKFSESDSDPDFSPEVDLATVKRRVRRSAYSSAATHPPDHDNSEVREEDIELVDLEDEDDDVNFVVQQAKSKRKRNSKGPSTSNSFRKSGKVIYSDSDPEFIPEGTEEGEPEAGPSSGWKRSRDSPSADFPNDSPEGYSELHDGDDEEPIPATETEDIELVDLGGEKVEGVVGQVASPADPVDFPCFVCNTFFETNSEVTTHILNAHCGELEVRLIALEHDSDLLGNFEIVDENDY